MNQESIGGGNSRGGIGRNGNNNNRRNGSGTRGGSGGGTTVSALQLDPGNGDGDGEGAEVRVVADEENNSLMIYSTGMQYKTIKAAVEKLDVPPTQVLIEASIVEVTLNDQLKYGLEWTFNNQLGGSDYSGVGVISDGNFNFGGAEGAVAQLAQGFSYTVSGGNGVVAVLQALATESLVNVISTPSVMVLDNNVATIQVGDQVPINSGSTVTNGGNTIQNISYKDTGVQLTVRPSVNAGGLVTLDVLQTVTDVGNIDVTGNRRFLERSIESRVAVRSGESVVLGGLIRENAANNENGVPWLHKAPIIGPLFGTTEKTRDRTELLVILTPRALYNDEELRQASDEMRDQIRNFELIEQ
jgi:general secretion pathway protein D